jgi:hypothetical protein
VNPPGKQQGWRGEEGEDKARGRIRKLLPDPQVVREIVMVFKIIKNIIVNQLYKRLYMHSSLSNVGEAEHVKQSLSRYPLHKTAHVAQ